jgi:hypothetical protein
MTDETNSGAASQVSPPRAPKPVTRAGVATGQLRRSDGKFGGKAPVETVDFQGVTSVEQARRIANRDLAKLRQPVPFDEALMPPPGYLSLADEPESSERPNGYGMYQEPDAVEGYREMVSDHDKVARLVNVAAIALVVGIVAYFVWQFFVRF